MLHKQYTVSGECHLINPHVALGGKKYPQLGFCVIKKIWYRVVRNRLMTLSEYEWGTQCNSQIINW